MSGLFILIYTNIIPKRNVCPLSKPVTSEKKKERSLSYYHSHKNDDMVIKRKIYKETYYRKNKERIQDYLRKYHLKKKSQICEQTIQ